MNEESFEEKRKKLEDALKQSDTAINRIVLDIQNGDTILKVLFIDYFNPFIIKCISVALGRFFDPQNSEECSIGLNAFNEAIDNFDEVKNGKFLNFARMVIQRRITEYLRYNKETINKLAFAKEGEDFEKDLVPNLNKQFKEVDYRKEMQYFEKVLSDFGITIEGLVEIVPMHKDEKELCVNIAKLLADNDELFNKLLINLGIPVSELAKLSKASKSNLKRNEGFIIAVALIFKYDFVIFRSYVNEYSNV